MSSISVVLRLAANMDLEVEQHDEDYFPPWSHRGGNICGAT